MVIVSLILDSVLRKSDFFEKAWNLALLTKVNRKFRVLQRDDYVILAA